MNSKLHEKYEIANMQGFRMSACLNSHGPFGHALLLKLKPTLVPALLLLPTAHFNSVPWLQWDPASRPLPGMFSSIISNQTAILA